MKKYTVCLFAVALLFGVSFLNANSASAYDAGCTGAGPYSVTTGQLCTAQTNIPISGCTGAGPYNIFTGQICTTVFPTPITVQANPPANISSQQFQLGARGSAVAALQQFLASAGFYAGRIDGIYGPITAGAYATYQASYYGAPISTPAPTISGLSGPQTLTINQQGTWSLTASNPTGGNLSYSVNWGDQTANANAVQTSPIASTQNASFTHTYTAGGNYVATFSVTNAAGQSAQASLSVVVVGGGTVSSLSITTPSPLPDAQVGQNYPYVLLTAVGGSTNMYTWTVSSGVLPPGLYLSPSTYGEIITGNPNTAGSYTFILQVATNTVNPIIATGQFTVTVTNTSSYYGTCQYPTPPAGYHYEGGQAYPTCGAYFVANPTSTSVPTSTVLAISSLSLTSGPIGTQVTIYGSGFAIPYTCPVTGPCVQVMIPADTINFGNNLIHGIYSTDGTSLTFTVPSMTSYVCADRCAPATDITPGTYPISITDPSGAVSNSINFEVMYPGR